MIDVRELFGNWRLVSFIEQQPGGEWQDALGAGAGGAISYWASGHMQVLIGSNDRPRLSGEWTAVPDAAKARCLDRMVAYAGRFTVSGERLLHHVDVCWIPNWEGREMVRLASFPAPHRLLLRTEAASQGRPRPMQEVLWQRAT